MAYDKIVAADDVTYELPPLVRSTIEANLRNPATGEGDAVQDVADSRITVARQNGILSPNYIINGGFDIWQRGNSITVPASTWTWTSDRWKVVQTGGSTTCSRESSIVPSFAQYSYKMTQATSAAQVFAIQTIETSNAIQLSGKTVTLSGYFASSSTTTVTIDIGYSTNVDNGTEASWTGYLTAISGGSGTVSSTSSFTIISGEYLIPSNAKSLQIRVWTPSLGVGTSLYFSGIQLEQGSVATPFRRNANSLQGELAACQRYYYSSYSAGIYAGGTDTVSAHHQAIGVDAASAIASNGTLPVPMRATPSITVYHPLAGASMTARNHSTGGTTITGISIPGANNRGLGYISASGQWSLGTFIGFEMIANAEL